MVATLRPLTSDDLLAMPDDGQRYEIIDGMLYVTPAPSEVHQLVAQAFLARLREHLLKSRVAYAMHSPADVRKGDRTRNRVQPDVFVVQRIEGARAPYPYDLTNILLAIEIESPRNSLYDYHTKRALYLANGVPEYWVVNPEARILSRFRELNDPGEVFGQSITWHPASMLLPLTIDLPELFGEVFDSP